MIELADQPSREVVGVDLVAHQVQQMRPPGLPTGAVVEVGEQHRGEPLQRVRTGGRSLQVGGIQAFAARTERHPEVIE
jgi:hypothetical protein